jgi:hypothetical protein
MVSKFNDTGSTTDRTRIGGPRSIRNETTIQRVAASVTEDNQTSTRKRTTQLGLSRSSLQRILNKDLKMFPTLTVSRLPEKKGICIYIFEANKR